MSVAVPVRSTGIRAERPNSQMKPIATVTNAMTAGMTVIVRSDCGASQGIVSTPGIIITRIQMGNTRNAAIRHRHTATTSPSSISRPEKTSSIGAPGKLCRPFGSPSKWNIPR